MFWFNKYHPNALYIDNRVRGKGHISHLGTKNHEVNPDIVMDFRDLDLPDKKFKLIVWDPPHLHSLTKTSIMNKKYGSLNVETWRYDLGKGFDELWRVLDNFGTLVFKWSESEIPLKEVLKCFKEKPLFGHPTAKNGKTIWCVFMKIPK